MLDNNANQLGLLIFNHDNNTNMAAIIFKEIWYGWDSVVIKLQLTIFQSLIDTRIHCVVLAYKKSKKITVVPTNEQEKCMFTMFMWYHLPYHISLSDVLVFFGQVTITLLIKPFKPTIC